jgi:anthranilate/para-aminobenzoate synthase component I
MRPVIEEFSTALSPDALIEQLEPAPGVVLLRSALIDASRGRYSFVTARPFLTFRSFGSRVVLNSKSHEAERYGNPWHILDELMSAYELIDEIDLPFPLGGCFGFWGVRPEKFR